MLTKIDIQMNFKGKMIGNDRLTAESLKCALAAYMYIIKGRCGDRIHLGNTKHFQL